MNEEALIDSWRTIFLRQKSLAERAMAQVPDEALHERIDLEANPISVIVKHMAGNMRSRWTDWLATDGEKQNRDRDDEFVDSLRTRDEIMSAWEEGWTCVLRAIEELRPADLDRTITIRGEAHTVPEAVNRQIDHYAYHIGQIVTFSRILTVRHAGTWTHLSVPPGGSAAFNRAMRERHRPG